MKMLNSIRTKLTFWYVGILALVLIAFAGLTYVLVLRVLVQEDDETLSEMARNFKTAIESEASDDPEKVSLEKDIREAIGESNFHDFIFSVYGSDNLRIASTSADPALDTVLSSAEYSGKGYSSIRIGRHPYRAYTILLSLHEQKYQLYILHSSKDQADFLSRLRAIFLIAVPVFLLLTGLGGYFLARKSLAPVVDMSRQAAAISATNLHERLPVKNEKDELGSLAQIFNALLNRLEGAFDQLETSVEQQRRFMADASHELRTPLAIVRGESEVTLARDDRSAGEYRESLAVVYDESKRLTRIVEDLFTLARADAGQFKLRMTKIYLDELLADCVRAMRVIAGKRQVTLNFAVKAELPMLGDEQLLRRLFINLLDNAVKYNRLGGSVTMTAEKDSENYYLTISDTGAGIAEDDRARIFERFYRADKARSRSEETATSGAGLGLAIAQWIATLHEGRIELTASDKHGSRFTIIFQHPETI